MNKGKVTSVSFVSLCPLCNYFTPEVNAYNMAVRTLYISGQNLKFMLEDCLLRKPEEACGLIVGQVR